MRKINENEFDNSPVIVIIKKKKDLTLTFKL